MDFRRFFGDNAQRFPFCDPLRLMIERPHVNLAARSGLDVTLINRLDAVKTNAIFVAAHQRHVLRVRPTQRHGRAGRATALHVSARQILCVPELLWQHAAVVGEFFQRLDKRQRIASGGQLVMTAFARQNRPGAAFPGPIVSAAVRLLSIAIVIVAPPTGALRQIAFEHLIDYREGIDY